MRFLFVLPGILYGLPAWGQAVEVRTDNATPGSGIVRLSFNSGVADANATATFQNVRIKLSSTGYLNLDGAAAGASAGDLRYSAGNLLYYNGTAEVTVATTSSGSAGYVLINTTQSYTSNNGAIQLDRNSVTSSSNAVYYGGQVSLQASNTGTAAQVAGRAIYGRAYGSSAIASGLTTNIGVYGDANGAAPSAGITSNVGVWGRATSNTASSLYGTAAFFTVDEVSATTTSTPLFVERTTPTDASIAAGIGASIGFRVESLGAGDTGFGLETIETGKITSILTTVTDGSEASALVFGTRSGGSVSDRLRIASDATVSIYSASNQLVLGTLGGNTTTLTAPAPAASRTYTIPDAGANDSFAMLAAAQTLSNKTFSNAITANAGITSSAATNLSVTTGTTGILTLDSGSTGSINLGTNANAKTITIGNATGATDVNITAGTSAIDITSNATGNALNLTANSVSTGYALNISSTGLTTGKAAYIGATASPGASQSGSGLWVFLTSSPTANGASTYGVSGNIQVNAASTGTQTNYAVYGSINDTGELASGTAYKYAGYFTATKTQTVVTGTTYTYGVYASAAGDTDGSSTRAYGIYATASGADANWAGYFDGNLRAYNGTVDLNDSSNFAVNIATGTSTGAVTIGGNLNTVAVNSSDWDISTTGDMTGIGAITANGAVTVSGSATTQLSTSTTSTTAGAEAISGSLSNSTNGSAWVSGNTSGFSGVYGAAGSGTTQYQAGVFGYQIGSGANSGGVVGMFSATYWGALGYTDASSNPWAGYFNSSVSILGTTVFGSGEGGTPTVTTVRGAAAAGTDIAGANLTFDASNGTGTGGSGALIFRTAPTGSTGATANTFVTRMQIHKDGTVTIGTGTDQTPRLYVDGSTNTAVRGESTSTTNWDAGVYGKQNSTTTTANVFGIVGIAASTVNYQYASAIYGQADGANTPGIIGLGGGAASFTTAAGAGGAFIGPRYGSYSYHNAYLAQGTGYRWELAASFGGVGVSTWSGRQTSSWDAYQFGLVGEKQQDFAGTNYYDRRSGGVLGSMYRTDTTTIQAWGSLGYKDSTSTDYGVYGSTAYATGTGYKSHDSITGIAVGGYGGVMGGWVRGEVLGFTAAGELYASYNVGNEYTSGFQADLVTVGDTRVPAFSVTSPDVKVYCDGMARLSAGRARVSYDPSFAAMIGPGRAVVTVTPMGRCGGLYIVRVDATGFEVAEQDGRSEVEFSYIAVGRRVDAGGRPTLPDAITAVDFDEKLRGVMFNENNQEQSATPIWWDGSKLRFDLPPKETRR